MNDNSQDPWPELPTAAWRETCATLQLWTQIVGKVRLAQGRPGSIIAGRSHSMSHARIDDVAGARPATRSSRSISISSIHGLRIRPATAVQRPARQVTRSPTFYVAALAALADTRHCSLQSTRCRTSCPIRCDFAEDTAHASTIPMRSRGFWHLVYSDRVFKLFRTGFLGKASPVHFFWGSFDLAVTRFSGRRAPRHPGGVPNCRCGRT